jgi:hypothetical protein
MKKWISKNWLLITLFMIGGGIFIAAYLLYTKDENAKWQPEFAKALAGLGMSAIIGGFIKLAFDENQKRSLKEKSRNEFSEELLNRLRKIFDAVDGARLLIVAHKSAKTYGDTMRENIIPSIVQLYDIKRSLKDSKGMMAGDKILRLRIYCHYMIAYMQAMADEFKIEYPDISNTQLLEGELQKQVKEKFIRQQIENEREKCFDGTVLHDKKLPMPSRLSWKKIANLDIMGGFIRDNINSAYRKMFVNFYEYNKRILKGQEVKSYKDCWYKEEHLTQLKETDIKIEAGQPLTEKDSMVKVLVVYLSEKSEEEKHKQPGQ